VDLSDVASLTPSPSPGWRGSPCLVYSPHPLMPAVDRETIYVPVIAGETIAAYLDRAGLTAKLGRRPVVVSIDGYRVPREMWKHCRPRAGKLIHVQAIVQKGGGGKNPIATILSIALMFVPGGQLGAFALGESVVAGSITQALVGGAIKLVGGMVINSLFPPPKPQLSNAQGQGFAAESPTYSLSGGGNRARPYEPMPVIMGNHRVFPDAGAKPYTEFEGEDQYLYQVFDFGYNDVVLSEFKIGQTPITDFTGMTLEQSDGTGALTLFPANVDVIPGAALTFAASWIQRTSSPSATALAVEITGQQFRIFEGAVVPLQRSIEIEYRAVGAGTWLPFWSGASEVLVWHNRRSPVRQTFKITVASGQYEVRVRRTSADETEQSEVSELAWSQLRTYQPDTADYTGRKRIAMKIKASGQLNGTVDQFNAIARAKCLAWNGSSWVTTNNSNPAWWYLAWARGNYALGRRVWGGGIADARIDIESLKAFGAWCDSKALSFNGVFDQPQSVFDGLSAIALMGRGTVSWGGGKLSAVWDAPNLPVVAVFGMSNIQAGSFSIDYSTEQLADEIIVNFINPDLDWQRDTLRVAVPGAASPPVRSRPVDMFGCTNKDMAGRNGNLYAANNAYRSRKYKWRSDFEAMPATRGDVMQLSHDLASLDYSGRFIEGGNNTTLKLERTVPLYAGGSFVVIVKPDQTFATYAVAGGTGTTNTLTLTSPLGFNPWADAGHPPYDYKWLYGATATPGKKLKIDSIRPLDERTVELTAVDERTEYYASESNSYTYVQPRPVFGGAQISNLQITADGVRAGAGYMALVIVSWDAGADYSFADVRASVGGGELLMRAQDVRGRSMEFLCADRNDVTVEVQAYGSMGRLTAGSKLSVTQSVDFAAAAPPSSVASLALQGRTFSWPPIGDVDVAGYRIRFHYNNRTSWDDANELHAGLLTQSPSTFQELPADVITYLIKAVDAADIESITAAAVTVDHRNFSPEGDPLVANVVETFDFDALGWSGTITGGTIISGDVKANSTTSFYGAEDTAPRYGSDGASFYAQDAFSELTYESPAFMVSAALAGSRMTLDYVLSGDPLYIEYRLTGPTALYGLDIDSFYGADTDPFYDAAGGYSVWPGAIIAANEEYQIRVTAGFGIVQGIFSNLAVVIDAPDIMETLDNVVIGAGGTRLPITRSYQAIKNVQLTLQNDGGTAAKSEVQDKNAALGPLVQCFNSADAAVAGTTDAIIQGY
jgi:hypothetical protein